MAPSRRKGSKAAAAAAAARRQWKVGDLVLAKVKGFQAWPAMVSEPEKWGYAADWKKVLVCFFGTQQIAFCNPADVEAFTEEKKQRLLGKRHGKYSEFGRALIEIIDTFEKLKKPDEGNNSNDTDEDAMVSENNTSEVLKKSVSSDKSPIATSEACHRKILSSGTQIDVSGRSDGDGDGDDMNCNEGMSEREVPVKDGGSGMAGAETSMITTYSTRRRSQRTQANKSSSLRRPLSARHGRSSSRVDVIELQNVSEPSGNCIKSIRVVPSSLRDRSAWRNKRMRKTSDLDDNEVDSPDVVSNCSAEGNDSGSLTADSDAISFNEGSTTEWDLKSVQPVSVTDIVQPDIEFCQRFDFQTNAIIHKKKRKPKRRRPMKESAECTEKLDEKVASDSDVKSETILRSDHERSPERCSKEDGDAHLPLLKRARVRMGRALSTSGELDTSEEKLQEESHSLSDQVSRSLHGEVDCSTDQEALHDNGDVDKSSPLHKHPENLLLWEVKTAAPSGSSLDVEAALPPSKRLHRALEAMSVNAAEDEKKYVDGPPTKMAGSSQNCSSSFNDFYNSTESKNCSELQLGKEEEFSNKNSLDGPLESPFRLDMPIAVGRASSAERTIQITSDSPIHESPKDGDHCSGSSRKESEETAVVECFESLSPHICEQVDRVTCRSGSPFVAMPSDDRCTTTATVLAEPFAETDHERPGVNCDVTSGDNVAVQSLDNGVTVLEDRADDSCKTTKSCDLSIEKCKDLRVLNAGDDVVENETTERGSGPSSSLAPSLVMISLCNGENQAHSGLRDVDLTRSISVSDDHSLDKSVSVSQSSSSLTDGLDSVSHATPHTLAGNTLASDKISAQFNGSCSPGVHSHFDVPKRASKWNNKDGQVNLASFEAMLGTLTRAKESIGRATRVAIDCAKYGVAAKVVEVLVHNLERESSLHRRVDIFFLVDSIAQCSKGLKGDFAGVYPSAILAVLPRLLSAAAPPGSSSRENRRQCLKVLRVWLERRILPESIIRQHIRELNSLCGSSCSRASSRSFRKERPFDDPVREMEGMLVDEYGSNSSFQLPGFCMPRMMRDDDTGVDSDGESFEAVTPEHNAGNPEVKRSPVPAVEKHRHILEDVDGELEMEDVAPAEGVDTACDMAGMNSVATSNLQIGNSVAAAVAPPLPEDVPPSYPPLPSSPPPPAPLPPPPPAVRTDTFTSSHNSKVYASSQVPNQIPNPANCSSFGDQYVSHPQIQSTNRNVQADVKGFRLRPPHPAPSNHFSYVQNERVQSQRDTPPHSNSNRFHMPNTESGNVYRDSDRMNFAPYGAQEHWRTPQPFPGPNYPDSSGIPYAPAPFASQHCEPSLPSHQLGFPSRGMNHQEFMHHAPPSGGPIPVSARGANFWRPR